MAGIAHATLLIEATERSGTLITARLATEYNRDVLVVPNSIFADSSKGAHQFLRLGATPVTSAKDILQVLNIPEQKTQDQKHTHNDLGKNEQKIYNLLKNDSLTRNEIIEKLNMNTTDINIALSALELKSMITERLGKIFITK